MNRSEILDTAKSYVTKDRDAVHGDAERNFMTIAAFWAAYLERPVTAADVAVMMTLMKCARIKAKPGSSHFDWVPGGGKAQRAHFTLKGESWQEISVSIPATGPLGIVRLYLPMQEQPVEIDWIELRSTDGGKVTRTEF